MALLSLDAHGPGSRDVHMIEEEHMRDQVVKTPGKEKEGNDVNDRRKRYNGL